MTPPRKPDLTSALLLCTADKRFAASPLRPVVPFASSLWKSSPIIMSNNNQEENPFAGFNMAQLNQLNPALFASLANQMGMNTQAGPSQPQNQAQQPAMGNLRNVPPQLLQQLQQQQQRQQSGQPPSQASINDTLQNIMLPTFNRLQGQNNQQMQQERLQAANNPAIQAQVAAQQVKARQAAQAVQAAQAQAHA